jgi:hypothetical protein
MHSSSAHNSITAAVAGRRELDARAGNGLDVRLWWDPVYDRVAVTVADSKNGLELEVPVRNGEAPLDVFRHPFAYAADHGLELRPAAAAGAAVAVPSTAGKAR